MQPFMIKKGDNVNRPFNIGARLLQLRNERSISQEKLANLANVTTTYYGQVERNIKNITVIKLEKICEVFDISLGEFFSDAEPVTISSDVDATTKSMQLLMSKLSEDEKNSMLQILRDIVAFKRLNK